MPCGALGRNRTATAAVMSRQKIVLGHTGLLDVDLGLDWLHDVPACKLALSEKSPSHSITSCPAYSL